MLAFNFLNLHEYLHRMTSVLFFNVVFVPDVVDLPFTLKG